MSEILHNKVQCTMKNQVIDKALSKLQQLLDKEILPVEEIGILTKLIESLDKL